LKKSAILTLDVHQGKVTDIQNDIPGLTISSLDLHRNINC